MVRVDCTLHDGVLLTNPDEGFLVPGSCLLLVGDDLRGFLDDERALFVCEGRFLLSFVDLDLCMSLADETGETERPTRRSCFAPSRSAVVIFFCVCSFSFNIVSAWRDTMSNSV